MKITWSIADIQDVYGTEKTQQTSVKPFVIPKLDDDIAKTDNAQKADRISTKVDMTDPNWYEKVIYDPFKAAKTESVNLPEWMQTKTEPKRSDAEILKEIEELAKEHARTGLQNEQRLLELGDEYISSVSPDRENILKNSTNEILERIESEMSGMAGIAAANPAEEAKKKNEELIDYLMKAIGTKKGNNKEKNDNDIMSNIIAARGNNIATSGNNIIASRNDGYYTQVDIDRGGGKITSLVYDNQGNKMPWMTMKGDTYDKVSVQNGTVTSAFFNNDNGQLIMIYSNGNDNKDGLRQIDTKAEHTRRKEIQAVYNAVYDFSVGKYNPHEEVKISGAMLTNVNGIGSSRALIKEVYDSTYERLRSEIA